MYIVVRISAMSHPEFLRFTFDCFDNDKDGVLDPVWCAPVLLCCAMIVCAELRVRVVIATSTVWQEERVELLSSLDPDASILDVHAKVRSMGAFPRSLLDRFA